MTLLILLARTAWARLVAPDFRLISHHCPYFAVFFSGGSCALVRPGEFQCRGPPRHTSLLQILRRLFRDYLQVEQGSNGCGVDSIEHLLEQIETLLLVFDERILLSIPDESDALFQVIE